MKPRYIIKIISKTRIVALNWLVWTGAACDSWAVSWTSEHKNVAQAAERLNYRQLALNILVLTTLFNKFWIIHTAVTGQKANWKTINSNLHLFIKDFGRLAAALVLVPEGRGDLDSLIKLSQVHLWRQFAINIRSYWLTLGMGASSRWMQWAPNWIWCKIV